MKKFLFRIARLKLMGTIVGFMFAHLPFMIPVKKIKKNNDAIAFFHPSPTYTDHILIIPRKISRTIFDLSGADFAAVIDMAVEIRQSRFHESTDFVLLINGGARQDVMQAHFHLFSGNLVIKKSLSRDRAIKIDLPDKQFWTQFTSNLNALLDEHSISPNAFSVFIQFENNSEPTLFLI